MSKENLLMEKHMWPFSQNKVVKKTCNIKCRMHCLKYKKNRGKYQWSFDFQVWKL
jgi:hypothetical protein